MESDKKSKTLTDDQIHSVKEDEIGVGRRAVMALLGAGAATAGALALTGCGPRVYGVRPTYVVGNPGYRGCSDQDPSDPVGGGRFCGGGVVVQQPGVIVQQPGVVYGGRSGMTDGDRGQCGFTDPAGGGRGVTCNPGHPNWNPNWQQPGVVVQPGGYQTGCTDADPQDGAGRGRRCGGGVYIQRSCSDADPYDGAGRGRRC